MTSNLFGDLTSLARGLEVIHQVFSGFVPEEETAAVAQAVGRVLAEDVVAPAALPGFKRSTVDGYAVRAQDIQGASESLPAYLVITDEVQMGRMPDFAVAAGQAAVIPTGGALPRGADAVVMVEYSSLTLDREVEIYRPSVAGENVLRADEDVRPGQEVLTAPLGLRPEHIGLLSGLGITRIVVQKRLQALVFSTGDEVALPCEEVSEGKIRDMNGPMLVAALTRDGCRTSYGGILPDSLPEVETALRQALEEFHLVLISGGSSVGQRDVTAQAIAAVGPPGVLLHGLAIRPGKPTIIGCSGAGKPVLGLPGHPVSAQVVYEVVLKPLLHCLRLGRLPLAAPTVRAVMGRSLKVPSGREEFVRVRLDWHQGCLHAVPVLGESGLLSTLAEADGLVRLAGDVRGILSGEEVEVMLLG